jgi:hypothetical protein
MVFEMKKILIVTQNFYPAIGSAGNRMKNIYQLLKSQGYDVNVLTILPSYPNDKLYSDRTFWDDNTLNEENKDITRLKLWSTKLGTNKFSRLIYYTEMMTKYFIYLIKNKKYDYYYVSSPPILIVLSTIISNFLKKGKLILEIRDLWPDSLIGVKVFDSKWIIALLRRFERYMYNSADGLVINSPGFLNHISSKLVQPKEIIYVPNGARAYETQNLTHQSSELFSVVYTGNLGLAQDISAIKIIASRLNDLEIDFYVIGYGVKCSEFKNYVENHNLHNVKFINPTTRKNSMSILKESSVALAFLSQSEVFESVLPGKILDYMTAGLPIVASVEGEAAQLICEAEAGFSIKYADTEQIISKIVLLKNDEKMRQQFSVNGKKFIEKHFQWEDNINRIADLLERV